MTGPPSAWRVVLAASAGNVLEWYDFIVFSFLAPQIAAAFFPHKSLLLTFSTFGASFLARPLGAAVIGGYADRRGRRAALTLSIALMAVGTLMLALMPRYDAIGAWSALGVLAARLVQGFSAGGEFGGSTALMIEHAPRRAGFFGSFQNTTQSLAAVLGSVTVWALTALLPKAFVADWGFRLPFILGLLIAPVGFFIRRHLPETTDRQTGPPPLAPVRDLLRAYPGRVALGACVLAAGTASTYLNIYLPTYAQAHLHMAAGYGFAISTALAVAPLFITPLFGWLADRGGVLPPMIGGAAALMLCALPGFLLVTASPTPLVLCGVLLVLTAMRSTYAAPMPALLAQMFPARLRGAGMSIAYTTGVVAFGGFAQLVLEWLIEKTGNPAVPGVYLAATAAVTLGALLAIRHRLTLQLDEVQPHAQAEA